MPALVRHDTSDLASEAPDGVTSDQLEKFWSELSPQERRHLLQIDKQILVEEARRCLYCSRCTASLVESFADISMHGKQEGSHSYLQDPSTHLWGCLAATNDGALTILDCFFEEKSLKKLRKVFDFGRSRERERELLYPNACSEGKRGWISQGVASNGKGNVVRETCAFHTAKISCETLVDYWSGLNDESRQSLLQMEEEDFVAKLTYRSKDKSFCPHCRKNFMREFKEVKELKRAHKEASCTNWFCAPDTRFRCEVMDTTIRAEWHQSFTDGIRSFCRFEWSVGTGEGKSDIMDFKDVGMDESAVVHGLDLRNIDVCYITLRAWKENGKYREFFVKAHALKGKQCIHRRLMFGDGLVSITTGGSMSDFFEQAEEVEDEEDDKLAERNEKDLEKDGPHPLKHAKDPEDARGLLLSIATVVFKQKVERAFRKATARQNAHFTLVGLALKMLEGRAHVACKEIITVKKQNQLLEEEEREKKEAEERSEKKKSKQREKKLRQKDQIGGKENINVEAEQLLAVDDSSGTDTLSGTHKHYVAHLGDTGKAGDVLIGPAKSEEPLRNISIGQEKDAENFLHSPLHGTNVNLGTTDDHGFITIEKSKSSRRKLSSKRDFAPDSDLDHWYRKQSFVGHDINHHVDYCQAKSHSGGSTTRPLNGPQRSVKTNVLKFDSQGCGLKLSEKSEPLTHISQSLKSEGGFNAGFVKLERNMRAEALLDNPFGVSSAPFESYTDPRTGICHTLISEQNRWESLDLQRMKPRNTSYVDVVMQPAGLGKRLQNSRCACSASEQCNFQFSGNDVQTVNSFICPHQDFGMPFCKSPSLIFEGCNNDGYEYREKSSFCVENILTCPATGSASIDNISTCPSEESSIESSGARATENWCTSDSEDSFHLSESRGIISVSENHEKTQKEGYLYDLTSEVAVEGQSFKYNHGPKIMSSSPPHPLGQLFPARTSDFAVTPSPFLQSSYLAMSSINYGMLEYQSRLQCMRLDAKTQHVGPSSESFSSRSNGKNSNPIGEQNSPPVPPVCTSKPFSFFHFGSPIARTSKIEINGAECIRHLDEVDKISYKAYHSAQEYRLFSRSNRSIFWFL